MINLCKNLRIKSVFFTLLTYSLNAQSPEGAKLSSFLSTNVKEYNKQKYNNYFTGGVYGGYINFFKSAEVVKGNLKKDDGILFISYRKNENALISDGYGVFIKGNFKKKQLSGFGEVCVLSQGDYAKIKKELANYNGKLVDFFDQKKVELMEVYSGDFIEGNLQKGYYSFCGNIDMIYASQKRKENQIKRSLDLVHLDYLGAIKDSIDNGKFKYTVYKDFLWKYGDSPYKNPKVDSVIIFDYAKNEKSIIKNFFKNIIYKQDVFNAKGDYLRTYTWPLTRAGKVGWVRSFEKDKISIELNSTNYKHEENSLAVPDYTKSTLWKDGEFYGEMKGGVPSGFGIYLTDSLYYEGFFNQKGEAEGKGFYKNLLPGEMLSNYFSYTMEEMYTGAFKANNFIEGEIIELDYIDFYSTKGRFVSNDKIPFNSFNNQFKLEGTGHKIYYDLVPSTGVLKKQTVQERGQFKNDLLNGKGEKRTKNSRGEFKYIIGTFENGELDQASKDRIAVEYSKKRNAEIAQMLKDAPFKPGTFLSKNGSIYYVNEIRGKGTVDLVPFPVRNFREGTTPQILSSQFNTTGLLAPTFYGYNITSKHTDVNKGYTTLNLIICNQCRGIGEFDRTKQVQGRTYDVESKSLEKAYDGVYATYYREKINTKTITHSKTVKYKEICSRCNGDGCITK